MVFLTKALVSGLIIALVSTLAPKLPRIGALILSLPLVSIGAIILIWFEQRNLPLIAQLSRETLILVPLGLAFFVPLAFSTKFGLTFWPALLLGIGLAALCLTLWLVLGKL